MPAYGELDLPEGSAEIGDADGTDPRRHDRHHGPPEPGDHRHAVRDPDGRGRRPHGQPAGQPDLLRRHASSSPTADTAGTAPAARPSTTSTSPIPLDVNRKRQARTVVARAARRTVEAQFQDAVRQQIDNLYTVFVDVAAAELTLTFSQAYLKGITRLLEINEELLKNKQIRRTRSSRSRPRSSRPSSRSARPGRRLADDAGPVADAQHPAATRPLALQDPRQAARRPAAAPRARRT